MRPTARTRRRIFVATLAALLTLQPMAQPLPVLGDGSEITSAAERRLGDRIARQLYRDPDYLDDPVLVEYVQDIWNQLLVSARAQGQLAPELDERFAWDVLLGKDRSVNAFALPGGFLGVHLGLIGVTATRDELASVLAHEFSHVSQRHIARIVSQEKRMTPLMLGAMLLGVLAASKSPHAANALITGGQAAGIQNQLNFSRDMEREADRIGYNVMTQAGFAPAGFVGMFEKLQQASRINDNGSFPYLRSHPLTGERIADMQARQILPAAGAAPATPSPLAPALRHALIAARARVLASNGTAYGQTMLDEAARPAPAAVGTGDAAAVTGRAATLYAAGMAALRQRDTATARRHADGAALLLQNAAGADGEGARRLLTLLQTEIDLATGVDSPRLRAVSGATPLRRPELLLAANRAAAATASPADRDQAAQRVQTWLATHPRDAGAWDALAALYRAQGERHSLRAVRAEGEAQVARYDDPAARDRFKAGQDIARRGGPAAQDHIEASIIDTRLRETEVRVKEQADERGLP